MRNDNNDRTAVYHYLCKKKLIDVIHELKETWKL